MNTTIKNIPFISATYDNIRMWLRNNISPQDSDIYYDPKMDDFANTAIFGGSGWKMFIIVDDLKSSTIIVDIADDNLAVMFALIARDL